MITTKYGKVVKGLGGLYETRVESENGIERLACRAKGVLKRDDEKVLIGDNVKILLDDSTPDGLVISEVIERKNSLIRPPMANLDYLFIVFAAKKPSPVIETVDKLVAISVHNGITPVIVITKSDLDSETADELASIYIKVGIPTFVTSSEDKTGVEPLAEYIQTNVVCGKTAAFAGASGVGKSTLMNALFPNLTLATAEISRKIERGRHTTRAVTLYPIGKDAYLADTPGFSMLDFDRFDFFTLDDLPLAFREINERIGQCKYTKCTHRKEEGCAIVDAVKSGEIAKSRHESYVMLYEILKNKHKWDK